MTAWTPERVELLKALHKEGRSASQIARALGEFSRNAVIGKCNRMGLGPIGGGKASAPQRLKAYHPAKPGVRKPKPKPTKPRLAVAGNGTVFEVAEAPPPRVVVDRTEAFSPLPGTEPVPFTSRTWNQCAWPVGGEGADTLCCGQPAPEEGPRNCLVHREMARNKHAKKYTPAQFVRAMRRWAA
ncbi:GcrA family cell cycle regulator [Phenylobacterium sp. VNQ135]|uniref:GcrA family cell cycle regulator n=1 Tax=Phenylobacterium sp. VNQ135 TaxID=3400922 RepID=UPI003BFC640E